VAGKNVEDAAPFEASSAGLPAMDYLNFTQKQATAAKKDQASNLLIITRSKKSSESPVPIIINWGNKPLKRR
jgi:hypothetical protein